MFIQRLTEKQLAIIVGENQKYIKQRLKKFAEAGLIQRKVLSSIAVNYLTIGGLKTTGLPIRNIHTPTLSKYDHSLGVGDVCVWFSMWRSFPDGSEHSWIPLGHIITERDFCSVREMIQTGTRSSDGQPVYVSAGDIHAPDSYFQRPDGFYSAIEYERTTKSSNAILRKNIDENFKRFKHQHWIYDDPYVGRTLRKIQSEIGEKRMSVYDIRVIRQQLNQYLSSIPDVISAKSGAARKSCLGDLATPIPLNRLPLLPEYQQQVQFETRDHQNPIAASQDKNKAPVSIKQPTDSKTIPHKSIVSASHAPSSSTSELTSVPFKGKSMFESRR